jgi:hypothetical protein
VTHEIKVGERRAEVGAVDVGLSGGLGVEEVVALGAENVYSVVPREIAEAGRKDGLALAEYTRATTEAARQGAKRRSRGLRAKREESMLDVALAVASLQPSLA